MGKAPELTQFQRTEMVRLNALGCTHQEVAQHIGCSKSTVSYTLQRYKDHSTVTTLARSGRKKISTALDKRALIGAVKKNKRLASHDLAAIWNLPNNKKASARTVRRVLQEYANMWRPAAKKPKLMRDHIEQRLEFCKRHKTWSKLRWRDVIFSDEMYVHVDSRKNCIMLLRKSDVKHDSNCIIENTNQCNDCIGIWVCMSYTGVKFFKLFSGRLNAEAYLEIMKNYAVLSLDMIEENKIKWPTNSPDLNCIENLWSWVDLQLQKHRIANVADLQVILTNILKNVPVKICKELVDSMPKRINECLELQGHATHY